jgi:hypothetical protein
MKCDAIYCGGGDTLVETCGEDLDAIEVAALERYHRASEKPVPVTVGDVESSSTSATHQ